MKKIAIFIIMTVTYSLFLTGESVAGDKKSVKIFSVNLNRFSMSLNLALSVESLLVNYHNEVKLKKTELTMVYYSGDNYIVGLSDEVKMDDIQRGKITKTFRERVRILESERSILIQQTPSHFPLIEKLYSSVHDPKDELSYLPDTKYREAIFYSTRTHVGDRFDYVSIGGKSPTRWERTGAINYYLEIGGKEILITVIGKVRGDPERQLYSLKKRIGEMKDPYILIQSGGIDVPSILEDKEKKDKSFLMKVVEDEKFDLLPLYSDDLMYRWEEIKSYPDSSPVPLVFTNFKPLSKDFKPPFKKSVIKKVSGVKIGFISLLSQEANPYLKDKKYQFVVGDPSSAAREVIKEWRKNKEVNVVAVISNLKPGEEANLIRETPEIDILMGSRLHEVGIKRENDVRLQNWGLTPNAEPAIITHNPLNTFDELTLVFLGGGESYNLTEIHERQGEIVTDLPPKESILSGLVSKHLAHYLIKNEEFIPDSREVWPNAGPKNLIYSPAAVWNLAAQVIRSEMGAEVVLLGINWPSSNVVGPINEAFVESWYDVQEQLVKVKLPGSALFSLLKKVAYLEVPSDREDYAISRAIRDEKLVSAGLGENGTVEGKPIDPEEEYTVITTQSVVNKSDLFPEFQLARSHKAIQRPIADIVTKWLKDKKVEKSEKKANDMFRAELRELFEGKTPDDIEWRLHLKDISFQFARTSVNGNEGLTEVQDARVQASDQLLLQVESGLFSELSWEAFLWDVGVSEKYGRFIITPSGQTSVDNETADELVFGSGILYHAVKIDEWILNHWFGPFISVSYNTEFSRSAANPRRKVLALRTGVKLLEGPVLRELRLNGIMDADYSSTNNAEFGYETGFLIKTQIPKTSVYLILDTNYKEFFSSDSDTADDLRRELETSLWICPQLNGHSD